MTLDEGAEFLLYTAGIVAQKESAQPEIKQTQTEESTNQTHEFNMIEDGDIVPYHQIELPQNAAEPDPAKESLPVEEIKAQGGTLIDNFYVKDSTESGTNLAEELLNNPAIQIKADGSPEVLLYHTHTSEAYMDQFTGFYYTDFSTRTQNQDMNVVSVGESIKAELEKAGIGVIHDTSVNDLSFNGSYARSWEVLQNNLAANSGIQVTIDIHRDSMTTEAGVKYKPTAEIGGRKAAQVMILAGCDANGDWGDFPDWLDNLHLALRFQQKAMQKYPDLMRPLLFSNSKYNMNATKGSMLIEVGTEVNTMVEAEYSGSLIGEVLAELLLDSKV
ncbi:stage II sporulation protein P [Scatolibacter rhodanostii]|uniref:stage II sporulation protein P n=1 Tax=Scatolibacter rhodanostii TaxID=2014781 RepID=UPI001356676B|nr:stage II sporulation protein P [Scatolibacter rhodanostii]